ncbi:MafI family immunity protein [uncultured Pluralibacter sp.]|uniref:MafI family immunity protein n=1 Tax=uncultured Pluralibacter sp. TaxID=1490864 RepID=UPI00260A29E9|nr:MafI family immunity protein [uncultured Pluralibacter sp.]
MNINEEIIKLGEGLKDRLDPSIIDFALDYINYSESPLSFETLCDYIADYNVKVSDDEYKKVIFIANKLGLEIDSRYTYINPNK